MFAFEVWALQFWTWNGGQGQFSGHGQHPNTARFQTNRNCEEILFKVEQMRGKNWSYREPYHQIWLNGVCMLKQRKTRIYIYVSMLLVLNKYPVALRAISATVPTAFFVLARQRLKENKPTKQQQLPKTGVKN